MNALRVQNKKCILSILLGIIVLIFIFTTACFFDVIITTRHGINFWHALVEGKIFDFYEFNKNCAYLPQRSETWSAIYNITIYVIFAIWDLPLFLFELVFDIDVLGTVGGILWGKSIVIPFLILSAKRIYDISTIFVEKKEAISTVFLFLTSACVLFTVITMGQYDIILLFFMLNGVYGYLMNNSKRFFVSFWLAIPLKLFALFIFVPLVLLKEKNILKISYKIIGGCSLYIITTFIANILERDAMREASTLQLDIIRKLFVNNISLSFVQCSLYIMLIIAVFIICFLLKKDLEIDNIWIIYLICFIYATFCVLCPSSPQWHILMSPFMMMLIVYEKKNRIILLILEIIATSSIILAQGIYLNNIISANMVDLLWLSEILGNVRCWEEYNSIYLLMAEFVGEDIFSLLLKLLVPLYSVCTSLFLIFSVPSEFKIKNYMLKLDKYSTKTYLMIRSIIGVVLSIIPLMSYFMAIYLKR